MYNKSKIINDDYEIIINNNNIHNNNDNDDIINSTLSSKSGASHQQKLSRLSKGPVLREITLNQNLSEIIREDQILSKDFNDSILDLLEKIKMSDLNKEKGMVNYFTECLRIEIQNQYNSLSNRDNNINIFATKFLTAPKNIKAIKFRLIYLQCHDKQDEIDLYNVIT